MFTSSVCVLKLKVQFSMQRKRFEECAQNLTFHVGGAKASFGFATAGSSCYKVWVGLNGFDPRTNFVLGGVRIGMHCMNLVTVISAYTRVPVTLTTFTIMINNLTTHITLILKVWIPLSSSTGKNAPLAPKLQTLNWHPRLCFVNEYGGI